MALDPVDLVKKLAFPRFVGTEGDKKAQYLVESEFNYLISEENLHKDEFQLSNFYMNHLLRYFYNPIEGLLIFIIIFYTIAQIYALIFYLSLILLFYSFFGREIRGFLHFRTKKIGKKYKSTNYWTKINAKNKNNKKNIVILAHYDSISHKFNPIFDGFIFFIALMGGTIFSVHNIVNLLFLNFGLISVIDPYQYIYGFFIAFLCIIQVFNYRSNNSDGALDNASGIGVIFYFLNLYRDNPLHNTNLYLVATGAEELGDWGAYNFVNKYKNELPVKETYFLIVDSIGYKKNFYVYGQGLPIRHFSPTIEPLIRSIVKESNNKYEIYPQYVPPFIHFGTDHIPIKPHGYEFIIFGSPAPIHSPKDNISNFDVNMFQKFNDFCKELLTKLDES